MGYRGAGVSSALAQAALSAQRAMVVFAHGVAALVWTSIGSWMVRDMGEMGPLSFWLEFASRGIVPALLVASVASLCGSGRLALALQGVFVLFEVALAGSTIWIATKLGGPSKDAGVIMGLIVVVVGIGVTLGHGMLTFATIALARKLRTPIAGASRWLRGSRYALYTLAIAVGAWSAVVAWQRLRSGG